VENLCWYYQKLNFDSRKLSAIARKIRVLRHACVYSKITVVCGVKPWSFEMYVGEFLKNVCPTIHWITLAEIAHKTLMIVGN
jgi:hypothetical protein